MILKRLSVENYAVFADCSFDLDCTVDRPVTLFTGNNGAGKTSLLDALRLVFHGRRSFLGSASEQEYGDIIRQKFHNHNVDKPCSINLQFEFSDFGRLRRADVRRTWRAKPKAVAEDLRLELDGHVLPAEEADDLLGSIVPPQILKYFFFDGEQIKELADFGTGDDGSLFAAVDELLGLNVVEQLERDLDRVQAQAKNSETRVDLPAALAELESAESQLVCKSEAAKTARSQQKIALRNYDIARQRFLDLGGLVAEERESKQRRIAELGRQIEALEDEVRREALGYLPLVAMRNTREPILEQVSKSGKVESAQAVTEALRDSRARLQQVLQSLGVRRDKLDTGVSEIGLALTPRPVAISKETPLLSLRMASWMQSVLTVEVPRLEKRLSAIAEQLAELTNESVRLQKQITSAPAHDAKAEAALREFELRHREMMACDANAEELAAESKRLTDLVSDLRSQLKRKRQQAFQSRRLRNKEQMIISLRAALPDYSQRLRIAKETRFRELLLEALTQLWHKKSRVDDVQVDLSRRDIRLVKANKEVNRTSLSAGEKQLFATAFIYAVAKLSNRSFPFVIDTPVGRLDKRHRKNLVVDFLPTLSHQVILFSTDTEIVGSLRRDLEPLISNEYDLADYNGGVTQPTQLEVAL